MEQVGTGVRGGTDTPSVRGRTLGDQPTMSSKLTPLNRSSEMAPAGRADADRTRDWTSAMGFVRATQPGSDW